MEKNIKLKRLGSLIVLLLMFATVGHAQTVHIGLDNGSLVNAVTPGDDTGWASGFSTLWRHEQLSLSMMGSDRDELTDAGGIGYPSAVFGEHNGKITITGGRRPTFIVVSLPKGYRITGYTIVLKNDLTTGIYSGDVGQYMNTNREARSSNGYGTMRFYETKPWATDQTNAGTHGRDNGQGYNANQVRYIEPGPDWENGQIGSEIIKQAMNGDNGDIRTDQKGQTFTISRTSQSEDDMGNQLYFRLVKDYCFYGVTIEEFRLQFTAEGTFPADVVPDAVGARTSLVRAPFNTSKIDIGKMTSHTKEGVTWYSFAYENVKDLYAYNYLYQKDAVEDGVPADVAPKKHIMPVQVDGKLLYALEKDTFFIETPTEIVTGSGNTAPIGYRIVGALFNPLWGTETEGGVIPGGTYHFITYTNGGHTYYLNDQGEFTLNGKTAWVFDNNGIHNGDKYLVYSSINGTRTLQIGTIETAQKIQVNTSNGRLFYQGNNTYYLFGATNEGVAPTMATINNNTNTSLLAAWTQETIQDVTLPAFHPGAYTLKVWKCDGTEVQQEIEISNENDTDLGKLYDMGLCNNDAIKFAIDIEEGKQALVQITLLLQALDPYIDKMDIVCTEDEGEEGEGVLSLTQPFTADDFSVSGGKFIFYVPTDYIGKKLKFTFSDLYSKYGDATYYNGGSGFGRYSFVTSDYFYPINGNGNDGLYDSQYDPYATYTTKVFTSTAGNIRFKFNNAEDLGVGGNEQDGYLEEYPFSVPIYLNSTDPGDPLSSTPHGSDDSTWGTFIPVKLRASTNQDENSGTFFVFTADETRWNIAPTTNLQHRFYAFYRMEIEVRARTFTPAFTWTKIYDETFYEEDGEEKEESMWGLTLDVSDEDDGQKVQGYLTYQEIINAINDEINNTQIATPDNTHQILYVDGTPLYAMINSQKDQNVIKLKDLQDHLAKNALVFLPEHTTSTEDNAAYMTSTGIFNAGKDIVLTDKQPFFSPYDIQVDAANYATYKRTVPGTSDEFKNVTMMLPFTIAVSSGVHTNADGLPGAGNTFTVNTMNATNDLALKEGSAVNYGNAYFNPISGNATKANTPYMIKIDGNTSDIDFIVSQKGAFIEKTPARADGVEPIGVLANVPTGTNEETNKVEPICTGALIEGAKTEGTFDSKAYHFTNFASYSGNKFDRAVSENVFYFGNTTNNYVDLHTLSTKGKDGGRYLYVFPFRGVYAYTSEGSSAKFMRWFNICYGENPTPQPETTAIDKMPSWANLMITTGKGSLTMTATKAQTVNILSVSGVKTGRVKINAGESQVVNLPAGVYIVNGTKIVVK